MYYSTNSFEAMLGKRVGNFTEVLAAAAKEAQFRPANDECTSASCAVDATLPSPGQLVTRGYRVESRRPYTILLRLVRACFASARKRVIAAALSVS